MKFHNMFLSLTLTLSVFAVSYENWQFWFKTFSQAMLVHPELDMGSVDPWVWSNFFCNALGFGWVGSNCIKLVSNIFVKQTFNDERLIIRALIHSLGLPK